MLMQARLFVEASQTLPPPPPSSSSASSSPAYGGGGKVNCRNLNNHNNTKQRLPCVVGLLHDVETLHVPRVPPLDGSQRRPLSNTDIYRLVSDERSPTHRGPRRESERAREQIKMERKGGGGCWLGPVFLSILVWVRLPGTSSL